MTLDADMLFAVFQTVLFSRLTCVSFRLSVCSVGSGVFGAGRALLLVADDLTTGRRAALASILSRAVLPIGFATSIRAKKPPPFVMFCNISKPATLVYPLCWGKIIKKPVDANLPTLKLV